MRYFLFIVSALLSCTAMSCKEGWTDEYKKEYIESCKEGARGWTSNAQVIDAYCDCALQKTMQHYESIEAVVENADSTQLSAEIDNCRAQALAHHP